MATVPRVARGIVGRVGVFGVAGRVTVVGMVLLKGEGGQHVAGVKGSVARAAIRDFLVHCLQRRWPHGRGRGGDGWWWVMERWHLEHGVLLVVVIVYSGVDWSWLFVNDTEGEGERAGVAGGSGDIGVGGAKYGMVVSESGSCFELPD